MAQSVIKRLVKYLISLLLVLVALLLALLLSQPHLLSRAPYRDKVAALVKKKTGLNLQWEGEIGWQLHPRLAIDISKLYLTGPQGQKVAEIDRATIVPSLRALLQGRIRIAHLGLNGVSLEVVVDSNSRPHWSLTRPPDIDPQLPGQRHPSAAQWPGYPPLLDRKAIRRFGLESLSLSNLRLQYHHIPTAKNITVPRAELNIEAPAEQQALKITTSFTLRDGDHPARLNSVQANGKFTKEQNKNGWKAEEVTLSISAAGVMSPETLTLAGDVMAKDDEYSGRFSSSPVNLALLIEQFGYPMPTDSYGILRKVTFDTVFHKKNNELKLNEWRANIDSFSLAGELAVTDWDRRVLNFSLTGTDMVIDPFVPLLRSVLPALAHPANDNRSAMLSGEHSYPAPSLHGHVVIPAAALQTIKAQGRLKLASLSFRKLRLEQFEADINSHYGNLHMPHIHANVYKGKLAAALHIKADKGNTSAPAVTLEGSLQTAELKSLHEYASRITGQAEIQFSLNSRGWEKSQLIRNLKGRADFTLRNGHIQGVSLKKQACEAVASFRKQVLNTTQWPAQTAFKKLEGMASFNRGKANIHHLHGVLEQLSLKGKGSVDLNTMAIDSQLQLMLTGEIAPPRELSCPNSSRIQGRYWPVQCRTQPGSAWICSKAKSAPS